MSALDTLLKVAQRQVDAHGREAALVQSDIQRMNELISRSNERELGEGALAASDVTLLIGAGAYRERMKGERADIRAQIDAQEVLLQEIRGRLAVAYQEKSRLETLIERQRLRELQERAAGEQKQLDEVAITLNQRNG